MRGCAGRCDTPVGCRCGWQSYGAAAQVGFPREISLRSSALVSRARIYQCRGVEVFILLSHLTLLMPRTACSATACLAQRSIMVAPAHRALADVTGGCMQPRTHDLWPKPATKANC
ncbi:hypothetical protein CAI18_01620 [Xanthomonas citri pv. punicae]|nr:hypothetical protein CAI14_19550 [Xanthomonas citri pv. punicae]QCZ70104.1 hypothetical protein CAI17_17185 [Xanthomonas citri pv. punicae]QCZ73224.1 hypothetical protein CAB38_10965 [Xanthomonas citri pv. punicae]QCZ78965.1 hypothetical protein XapA_21495 [Xanthomonas citri pv. punicae]QCZ79983.1 hypothetical protein XapB_02010 [Xanthomonas citri pv. punicae]